jgi:hypothetical protein
MLCQIYATSCLQFRNGPAQTINLLLVMLCCMWQSSHNFNQIHSFLFITCPCLSVCRSWSRLPYQLNPTAGPEAINKLQYYNDKFGPARVAQIIPNMQVIPQTIDPVTPGCGTSSRLEELLFRVAVAILLRF